MMLAFCCSFIDVSSINQSFSGSCFGSKVVFLFAYLLPVLYVCSALLCLLQICRLVFFLSPSVSSLYSPSDCIHPLIFSFLSLSHMHKPLHTHTHTHPFAFFSLLSLLFLHSFSLLTPPFLSFFSSFSLSAVQVTFQAPSRIMLQVSSPQPVGSQPSTLTVTVTISPKLDVRVTVQPEAADGMSVPQQPQLQSHMDMMATDTLRQTGSVAHVVGKLLGMMS